MTRIMEISWVTYRNELFSNGCYYWSLVTRGGRDCKKNGNESQINF